MTAQLHSTLLQLSAQPNTEHPFLSVYLDWTTDGSGKRQSPLVLEQELDQIAAKVAGESAARKSFEADRERIMQYVSREAPDDARGLAIFACSAEGVWEALPLQVAVDTQIIEDRHPHLFHLARILDDYETYAVVLADGQESRIFVVALNDAEKAGETAAAEEIKRFDQGGTAQMLFQRRTDNIIKAHTKDIAEKLDRIIKRYDVQHVVIAGNDSIKGMVMDSLSDSIKDKLVDYIHLDIQSNIPSIMEAIEPMMRDVERKQEADAVADLQDQLATRGGLGAVGITDVAMALSKGQVGTLLLLQSFNGTGGECLNCGMLHTGAEQKCPYDGAEMRQVDLREAFTARALQQGADIQIVENNDFLAQQEGVAALLRYRDDQQARTV